MNTENTRKLLKRFPYLYKGYWGSIRTSCMPFGFECGDGWYHIIWQLSLAVEEELKQAGVPWWRLRYGHILLRLSHIWNNLIRKITWPKHWGEPYPLAWGLMWHPTDYCSVTQVKEKYGTLRYYVSGVGDIWTYERYAEIISSKICEQCGERGELICVKRWYLTMCKKCLEAYKNRFKKKE